MSADGTFTVTNSRNGFAKNVPSAVMRIEVVRARQMKHATRIVLLLVTAVTIAVAAQESKSKPPAAADWAALAKLPD